MSKNTVKTLLSSIGLSGFLLVLGYMIDFSQRQLLGFDIRSSQSVQGYLFLGASMLVGTFVSAIVWGIENPVWLFAGVLCLVALFYFRKPLRGFSTKAPILSWLGLFVFSIGVADIILLDLPSSQLKDVLRSDLRYRPDLGVRKFMQDRGKVLWQNMICSRMSGESVRSELKTQGIVCRKSAEDYQRVNRNRYLADAAIAMLLLLFTCLLLIRYWQWQSRPVSTRSRSSDPSVIVLGALGMLALINTLLLPWTYGKLQESTILKDAVIQLSGDKKEPVAAHGFILSEDASTVVLFNKTERHLWFVPRNRIQLIQVERHEDVIKDYHSRLLENKRRNPGAPPSLTD